MVFDIVPCKSKFSHFSGFYQIAILVKINQTWITLKYIDVSLIFTHKYVKTLDYFLAKFIFTVQVSRAHFSLAIVPTSNDSVWKARQPTMRKNLTVPRQLMPKEGKIYAKTTASQLLCVVCAPHHLEGSLASSLPRRGSLFAPLWQFPLLPI